MVCSLVTAMMLGLYPRGRKTAIFDVRVRIIRRMHELVTGCYSMDTRRTFILDNLPVLQLAFAEYAYNFIVDFMPVEADILGITPSIAVSYATTCDQFREKFILTGMETWEALSISANTQIDKLIRNMRMGPVQGVRAEHLGSEVSSGSIMPICTSSAPKKRRTASSSVASATTMHHFYQTGGGDSSIQPRLMVGEGDIVLLHDYLGGHRQEGLLPPPLLPWVGTGRTGSNRYPIIAGDHHHTRLAETSTGVHCHLGGSGVSMLHKPMVSIPKAPVSSALLDLHVCRTDGLSKLYPSLPPADLAALQVLHTRVSISLLPQSIAMEQQNSLERFFLGNCVRMAAARSIYICTSCALGGEFDVAFVGSFCAHTNMDPKTGKPTPLRPCMRYSLLSERFTCMTCHRHQRAKGQQQRRDKGAKLATSGTSIICIDMIGKVVRTGGDLAPALWRSVSCIYTCCIRAHMGGMLTMMKTQNVRVLHQVRQGA